MSRLQIHAVPVFASILLAVSAGPVAGQNAVTDWATIVQPSIHNASVPWPPASSEVLHTIVQLAVYDAVVAIEGGGVEPYSAAIEAPSGTDVLGLSPRTGLLRAPSGSRASDSGEKSVAGDKVCHRAEAAAVLCHEPALTKRQRDLVR